MYNLVYIGVLLFVLPKRFALGLLFLCEAGLELSNTWVSIAWLGVINPRLNLENVDIGAMVKSPFHEPTINRDGFPIRRSGGGTRWLRPIPKLDLKDQVAEIDEETRAAIRRIFNEDRLLKDRPGRKSMR